MNFLRLNGRPTTSDTGNIEYSLVIIVKALTNYYRPTTLHQIYNSFTKQSFKIKITNRVTINCRQSIYDVKTCLKAQNNKALTVCKRFRNIYP